MTITRTTEPHLVGTTDCTTTHADNTETENTTHLDQRAPCECFQDEKFLFVPTTKQYHAQLTHSKQGSSPGLWTIREIRSRVPVSQRLSASTFRPSKSFYLHTTQTTRDNHPYSKYCHCLNDRRYCASDLTFSRVYRVENMFLNLLNIELVSRCSLLPAKKWMIR